MTESTPATTTVDREPDQPPEAGSSARRLLAGVPRLGMAGLLVVIIVLFGVLRPDTFATTANFRTVLVESAVLTIVALAVMVPLISNDFDLSIASVLGFSSILAAGLPARQGFSVPLTILAVLGVGLLVGAIHSLFIVTFGLSSVVVTLGTGTVLGGLVLWYTGGQVIYQGIPTALTDLGSRDILGVPAPVLYMAAVAAGLWFVLDRRPWGRYLYAVGSSETAARLAGIQTDRVRMLALTTCSVLSSFAGLVLTARLAAGNPTISAAYFLPAFAAAFLSLAAFKLGFFNPLGVVLSVYLLAFGVNGLTMMGAPFWVEPVFNGAALILAISLAQLSLGRGRRLQITT